MGQPGDQGKTVPKRSFDNRYMALKTCRYGTMLYNVNDLFIGRSLDLYGEWREAEMATLGQVLSPGDVVLDVGANIGTHTVFFAKTVTDRGAVFAFEPQRLAFQNLCANVALNALLNVYAYHVAVGSQDGKTRVPVLDPRVEGNFGGLPIGKHQSGEEVRVIRIDDWPLVRCKLMKIDVEGMECEVLQGARKTIERFRPILFVENNTTEGSGQIIRGIQSLGYRCFWHLSSYYNPDNYFQNKENVFARYQPEANMLCFHKDTTVNISGFESVTGPEDDWRQAHERMKMRG